MFRSQPVAHACGGKPVPVDAVRAPESPPRLAPKYSRELMKMLAQLVMLR